jgi:hypothetical protein
MTMRWWLLPVYSSFIFCVVCVLWLFVDEVARADYEPLPRPVLMRWRRVSLILGLLALGLIFFILGSTAALLFFRVEP